MNSFQSWLTRQLFSMGLRRSSARKPQRKTPGRKVYQMMIDRVKYSQHRLVIYRSLWVGWDEVRIGSAQYVLVDFSFATVFVLHSRTPSKMFRRYQTSQKHINRRKDSLRLDIFPSRAINTWNTMRGSRGNRCLHAIAMLLFSLQMTGEIAALRYEPSRAFFMDIGPSFSDYIHPLTDGKNE